MLIRIVPRLKRFSNHERSSHSGLCGVASRGFDRRVLMHGRLRYLAVTACGTAALLVVAGCGVGGGSDSGADTSQTVAANAPVKGTITFQTWSLKNQTFTPYFTSLISAFEAKYTGTKINWIDQPGDGYQQKVASQVTSKTLPDVINLPPNIAYPLATSGNLLDLTKN